MKSKIFSKVSFPLRKINEINKLKGQKGRMRVNNLQFLMGNISKNTEKNNKQKKQWLIISEKNLILIWVSTVKNI